MKRKNLILAIGITLSRGNLPYIDPNIFHKTKRPWDKDGHNYRNTQNMHHAKFQHLYNRGRKR